MTEHGDMQTKIVYIPKILRNMAEICNEMGVGAKTVKKWVAEGAPIAVEGKGSKIRYSAEEVAVQAWRVNRANFDRKIQAGK